MQTSISPGRLSFYRKARELTGRSLVVLYLLLALVVSGGIALQSWPDNPLRQRLYLRESEQIVVLQVTAESLELIERGIGTLARLPVIEDEPRPNRADLEFLTKALTLAEGLPGSSGPSSSLPSSPLRWNRQQVDGAATVLRRAHARLERRKLDFSPPTPEPKQWVILLRTFWPDPITPPSPLLSVSEQARVGEIQADLRGRSPEPKPTTETGRKLRPLLENMQDADFMLLVLALGAWGASAQALASIAAYFGSRRYIARWAWYYVTRPFIGASLSFAFYVILRAGLLSASASWSDINHMGYAGIAVLVGFCATEALENLKRVAAAFFQDKQGADALHSGKPHIQQLHWDGHNQLEIIGTGFAADARVLVDGKALPTSVVDFETNEKLVCKAGLDSLPDGARLKVSNPGDSAAVSAEMPIPAHRTGPAIEKIAIVAPESADASLPSRLDIFGRNFTTRVRVIIGNKGQETTLKEPDKRVSVPLIAGENIKGMKVSVVNLQEGGLEFPSTPLFVPTQTIPVIQSIVRVAAANAVDATENHAGIPAVPEHLELNGHDFAAELRVMIDGKSDTHPVKRLSDRQVQIALTPGSPIPKGALVRVISIVGRCELWSVPVAVP